ncbi:YlbE-like family protein [Bacillus aquiflavi]|uniref:YlbE-like family protein n=1 Tax=Bacillus aquiflavi TaxID=2672567 RepID=A0A6B3W3Z4_9BACI|nr:YlbE-like family protein [Bacillus aquiflavi]MBA4537948.1 YlbE-like family protein [Bacillus aquiflavi]NEY82204.1 hypothetical protein [Bacillus aquiflavi]UAC49276.1 YlbE-like family protein [Bacillus aquiflavi]
MRTDVLEYLNNQQELKQFVRAQPFWYRKLTRNPLDVEKLEIAALHYYKKTIPHKVEKFSSGIQMVSMMMNMFQAMNSK